MAQHSSQRIAADHNFLKTQTQSLARNRIMSESESLIEQRDANTAKLREQRLAKEAFDRHEALTAPAAKKGRRTKAGQ